MADAESGARVELRPLPEKTSGLLRMTAPSGFRQSVAPPMLASLLKANPELRIDFDIPIIRLVSSDRGSTQPCGSRRWGTPNWWEEVTSNARLVCAAQGYLKKHGRPLRAADLDSHASIRLGAVRRWPLIVDGALIRKRVDAYVTTTGVEAERCCARSWTCVVDVLECVRAISRHRAGADRFGGCGDVGFVGLGGMPSRRYVPNRANVFLYAFRNQLVESSERH
ncbi:LysR family transcriptional regulator [Caballeronia arvi]|uniref:LysR family transcriptional regulator n=2 Tax=Caballeronia arvi TaxID=1777135 RepID=A0A158L319_9BURK|nr:LysR family transcriptional regulator [Caballeronia arvi]